MLERLRAYQSKYGSLKGEAYRAHTLELEKNPALHREVDELSRYFLNKSVSRCGFCLIEADLALRRITEQQMKNVAHPDYELRAGTLLHDPINKEFSKILTPRNITEDLCLYHIAFNKDALSYFTRVPEDLNDRLEKFMSRYGKEMPDKDVEINSFMDLDGYVIGVQKGTTADILMGDYESTQTINVTVVANDKLSNCFTQLTNGEIQAVVVDSGVAESYVAKNPELYKIVYQDMTEGEQFAIAMGLNDTDMQAAINKAMAELEEDGTLKEIYEYWFGADAEETAE